MWSILSHTESFINESEAWCETVSSKTAVNINDDGRHLSKQRQVSFLIYGNFHRFEISFFPLWSYLHGDTRDPVTLCATVQTCSELIRREKKYFGNACPQLLATVTGTKSNLTGCWYVWKRISQNKIKNDAQSYNIEYDFSIIFFRNNIRNLKSISLFTFWISERSIYLASWKFFNFD